MKRNLILIVPAFFIINSPSVRMGMIYSTAGSSDTRNYMIFSCMNKQTIGTNAVYPYV